MQATPREAEMNQSTGSEIPTFSLLPMHESIRNGPSIDELYVERKNLQREWTRFLESISDQVDNNSDGDEDEITTIERINDESSDIADIENNTPKPVMLPQETGSRFLDKSFPGNDCKEDNTSALRNEELYIACTVRSEDKESIMVTFQSLNEQVDQLRGILDSIGNLPLCSTNRSFKKRM